MTSASTSTFASAGFNTAAASSGSSSYNHRPTGTMVRVPVCLGGSVAAG